MYCRVDVVDPDHGPSGMLEPQGPSRTSLILIVRSTAGTLASVRGQLAHAPSRYRLQSSKPHD